MKKIIMNAALLFMTILISTEVISMEEVSGKSPNPREMTAEEEIQFCTENSLERESGGSLKPGKMTAEEEIQYYTKNSINTSGRLVSGLTASAYGIGEDEEEMVFIISAKGKNATGIVGMQEARTRKAVTLGDWANLQETQPGKWELAPK